MTPATTLWTMSEAGTRGHHIVAMGGGGFSVSPDDPLLDDFILGLAGRSGDRGRPRICFVPMASGDAPLYVRNFYDAFAGRTEASWLPLFERDSRDLRAFLLAQDVVYVGGGNTENMLAIWRLHGVDAILREAWDRGVVLAGLSAGSLCWFESGVTDSFGPGLAPLRDGLGFLPGSHCPHYDGETLRRPSYHDLVANGLAGGYAADDGAALHFVGAELAEVVTSRPTAGAYRVTVVDGRVVETRLPSRYLGT
jgi:dipeptidase E